MIKNWLIILISIYIGILALIIMSILYVPPNLSKQVRIVMQQEPSELSPIFGSMSASAEIENAIYRPMVRINPDGKPIPILVKEIPTKKNGLVKIYTNTGQMEVTWRFKTELLWQDKYPLTPDDVIFTWKVKMHPKVQVETRDIEERIISMKKDPNNPNNLIVLWKETYAYYYQGHPVIPKHVLEHDFKTEPHKLHINNFNKNPIGNGPYKIKEWRLGNYILLERNNNYSHKIGQKPYFNSIFYRFISDTNAMIIAMISKDVDAISPVGIGFDQIIDFKKTYGNKFKVYSVNGIIWEHIDINMDNHILKDKKVRKALLYGINRNNIIRYFFANELKIAHSWLPPKHPGYYPRIKKYSYNPQKAIDLLVKAGWDKINKDGFRINKSGQVLRLTLLTTAGNKIRERVQVAFKENLKFIGIDLVINKNQNAVIYFGETTPKRQFQLAMYAWIFSPLAHGLEMWSSDYIPSKNNNWFGQNYPGYKNQLVDHIHKQIPLTINKLKRAKLFYNQQKIWIDDLPVLPLYFRKEASITRKDFLNWSPTGTDLPITWNCEKWQFKKD